MPLPRHLVHAVARTMSVLLASESLLAPVWANPVADPKAPAGKKPIVDIAPNNVRLVHIAPPNGARVSHNLFKGFSVPGKGVILNNRTGSGPSQLGGNVGGNPQLGTVTATLIINEVTMPNLSTLLGRIEVAGDPADVVIANPWGITCDGCGFINTGRATLATGRPSLGSDGRLASLGIEGGTLTVGSTGLSAAGLRELDLMGRGIVVVDGATVQAEHVYAVAGRNTIDYATLASTPLPEADGKPSWAIQIPYSATLNAHQIYLVATELGVGVRQAGSLTAGSGGLQIDAGGPLLLDGGRMRADGGVVTLGGSSIAQNGGRVESSNGLVLLQATQSMTIDDVSLRGADVVLTAGTDATLSRLELEATGDLRLFSGGHLQMDGGRAQAGADLALSAGADLKLGPIVITSSTPVSGGTTDQTTYLVPELRAGRDVSMQAPNGIVNLDGVGVDAGGEIAVVGQSIGLIGPKDYLRTSTTVSGKTTVTEAETLTPGSLRAGLDISMVATGAADPASDPHGDRGHILLTGAQVDSDTGQVSLLAQRDIDVANDVVSASYFQEYWQKRRRLLYTKTTHVITSTVDQEVKPSEVGGRSINIAAGRDLNLVASSVVADGALGLHADNDLSLLSTGEVHQAYNLKSVKKSGLFGSGGFGITIGTNRRTEISDMLSTQQIGATVGSAFGDIALTAGNQYLQLSSEVVAGMGDVAIAAREVAVQTNNNTRSLINSVRQTQSGITLTAGHPLITAAQTTIDMARAVERTENPRLKALGVLTAGLSVWQAYKELNKTKSTTPADWISKDNWTFNLTLGSSSTAYDSVYKESLPQESQILAGRHLSIMATGSGAAGQGDISVIGSGLSASGDVSLRAANDLNLISSTAATTDQTRTRSSAGAIGLQLSGSGSVVGATLSASKSRGFTNGWGTTYFPVEIAAGGTLSFDSWRDTNASGATLDGSRVVGTVGSGGAGNLVLASPQDQGHFVAKESSLGFNLTVGDKPNLGLSVSDLKLLADWQSAREQTAIRAGSGGFDLTVNGTTFLRGAAITSTADAGANRLATQTLLHETVANRDNASGVASTVQLSLSHTKKDGTGALAGSAFGYAQIDRAHLGSTAAALAPATLSITRPDLQAGIAEVWRSRERAPVASDLALQQAKLDDLLESEPPKYPGMGIEGTPPGPLDHPMSGGDAGSEAMQTPTPEWTDWNYRVGLARTAVSQLSATLNTIDTKVYGQPSNLSRSPNTSHLPLAPALDGKRATEELRAGVAITAAFGKAAFREAGDYADKKRDEELKKCNNTPKDCAGYEAWKEGGKARAALHAVIGALNYGSAGAVGATANQLATPVIESVLIAAGLATRDPGTGVVTYTALGDVVRAGAGSAIGFGVAGGQAGAAAFAADSNNRQLHPDLLAFITDSGRVARYASQRGISELAALDELIKAAAVLNDSGWAKLHPEADNERVRAFLLSESVQLRLPDGSSYFAPTEADYIQASLFVEEALSGRGRDLYRTHLAVRPEMLDVVTGLASGGIQGVWNAIKNAYNDYANAPESIKAIYAALEVAAKDPARAVAAVKLALENAPASVAAELKKTADLVDLYEMYGDYGKASSIGVAAALSVVSPSNKIGGAAHLGIDVAESVSKSLLVGAAVERLKSLVGTTIELAPLSLIARNDGILAEQLAKEFAQATGLQVRALQNNSRHGVDLYAFDPAKNQYIVFEVKSSTVGSYGDPDPRGPADFLALRASRAEQGQGWWNPKSTPTDLVAVGKEIGKNLGPGGASVIGFKVEIALPSAPVAGTVGLVASGGTPKLTIQPWGGP